MNKRDKKLLDEWVGASVKGGGYSHGNIMVVYKDEIGRLIKMIRLDEQSKGENK